MVNKQWILIIFAVLVVGWLVYSQYDTPVASQKPASDMSDNVWNAASEDNINESNSSQQLIQKHLSTEQREVTEHLSAEQKELKKHLKD